MAQIIAGLYELEEKIGAGGGGVVYLGRHIRLDKQVVLKADKRTLSVGAEKLRREVDLLKGLSHTYIPQVYDFVQEDGVVYTVMDYIRGESLDKLLARHELPTQAQLVKWACQLLEALVYLHNRPPYGILHGDIKPANIMLRPDGDMCLIDFNIALALGEEGAVKVGFSRGYASPEHYGADYLAGNQSAAVGSNSVFRDSSFLGHRSRRRDSGKTSSGDGSAKAVIEDKSGKTAAINRAGKTAAPGHAGKASADDGPEKTEVLDGAGKTVSTDGSEETVVLENAGKVAATDGSEKTVLLTENNAGKSSGQISGRTSGQTSSRSGSSTCGEKGILLDVRSDIYSLGATLYHLISGRRPAQDAREVEPLGPEICSEAVAAILRKAMAPQPRDRYQTAEDMLADFRRLHRQDRRTVKHIRRMVTAAAVLTGGFLVGGVCVFIGLKQMEQRQGALALAEYSANALSEGDVDLAVRLALQAIPEGNSILEAPVAAEAQKALTDALGVYDLADGFKSAYTIELAGAPFDLSLSPEGTRLAVVYGYEAAVYDLDSQERIATLAIQQSALSDCLFTDEDHVVYAGQDGVALYDLAAQKTVWTGEVATTLAVSADGSTVAAVNRDADHAVIYHTADGKKAECSFNGLHMAVAANDIFADPKDSVFALNDGGNLLAVSFSNGGLMILNLENREEDLILYDASDYRHFAGGFCGKYFAFAAGGDSALFGLVDTEEAVFVGGMESDDDFLLKADEDGIYLGNGNVLVELDPFTLEKAEVAYTGSFDLTNFAIGGQYAVAATKDNHFSFYNSGAHLMSTESGSQNADFLALEGAYAVIGNRTEQTLRVMRLESHEDAQLASYDARYAHDEARVSADGKTVMLFGYEEFCVCDMDGGVLARVELPDADQIYDQQFVKGEGDGGSWLEVIWYDGTRRCYSASDGSLLSQEMGEAPDKDLYEEFYVGQYRIASSLHAAPEVYDRESGRLAATLEGDAYLTYVTQAGEYIITEYISAAGERYGLLLDQRFQTLAYLPGLCDVAGDRLVFDDQSGNLRQSRLYSLQELVEIGKYGEYGELDIGK